MHRDCANGPFVPLPNLLRLPISLIASLSSVTILRICFMIDKNYSSWKFLPNVNYFTIFIIKKKTNNLIKKINDFFLQKKRKKISTSRRKKRKYKKKKMIKMIKNIFLILKIPSNRKTTSSHSIHIS